MKKYISYSQINTFLYNPMEFYQLYVLGLQPPKNDAMILGSIIHKALEDEKFDWNKELKKEGFTADYERAIGEALPQIERPKIREQKLFVPYKPVNLYSILDGIDGEIIVEYKTSKTHWNQKRVDSDLQISFYAMIYWLEYGKMPKGARLISINTNNGSVREFFTKRRKKDFKEVDDAISHVYEETKRRGWKVYD